MEIVQAPNPVLSQKTKAVKKIDGRIKKIVRQMIEEMLSQTNPEGVGLAANQVGLNLAIFVMRSDKKSSVTTFINPQVIKAKTVEKKLPSKKTGSRLEGCLSIKNVWAHVKRPSKVLLSWTDLEGKNNKRWFTGFAAAIVQHEFDHLQGKLFTELALSQKSQLYREIDGELEEYAV